MHSGPRCDLPVAVSTGYRMGPDIAGAAIAGLKRVAAILSVGEPSDISFTFITAAKKSCTIIVHPYSWKLSAQPYQPTCEPRAEISGRGCHLAQRGCNRSSELGMVYKSQCESDIPASVEKQLCCSSREPIEPFERPQTTAFCCFSFPSRCQDLQCY